MPRSLSQQSSVAEVYGEFLGPWFDMHCELEDLIHTGVSLFKSCQINLKWTPLKFEKHLKIIKSKPKAPSHGSE